jgi:hypothetical protein
MMSEDTRVTRRAVLGGAAAVGAGALIAPAATLAGQPGGGRVFSLGVGGLSGVSPVIPAGRPFVLAGVQWSEPAEARIELRARAVGGRWSPWALASVQGHEPDRTAGRGGHFGEPMWFGLAVEIQVRTAAPVRGVRLHFVAPAGAASVDGGPTAAAAQFRLATPVLPAGPGQPPIIARQAWAGRGNPPSNGPFYGSINLAFVHHTDNPNGYSAGEVPGLILAIYDYHRFARGYFDIAYNFVIDAFGRIWEARAGGIDEPVIGAHAGGYNSVSTGIAVLGTFMFQLPPPPALAALAHLLAWKLSLHGVPTLGKVRVEVDPFDAFYTPFAPGQRVLLPRIAGHRDGDLTDCPGDDLYGRLPAIRSQATTLAGVPSELTLAASRAAAPPGTPIVLSGTLTKSGAPIPGAVLEVQTVSGLGVESTVATVTTGADGSWSTTLPFQRSAIVRALYRQAPAAVSDLVAIGITPAITLALVSTSPLRVSGTITPRKRKVTLSVYKLSGAHRRLVLTRTASVHQGRFTARLALGRAAHGGYVIVARTAADAQTAAGASPPLSVSV